MAEPLFIVADIHISAPALRRWLKSAPLSAAAFDDWPASASLGASGITELAAPEKPSVADALVSYCADGFGREMGICIASTTSRRMRSDSRRASSMATRPAPWRPRFSLRFAARIGGRHTARQPSLVRLFDAGADLIRIEIGKQSSRVLPAPAHAPAAPHGSTTGSARTTWATGQAHGRAVPSPGPRPEEAAGAGRAASQPGCAPPLRQPLLDRRRACIDGPATSRCQAPPLGLSGGSRPPTPWTRRSTRMDDRSGTTAPWWGRARTGA